MTWRKSAGRVVGFLGLVGGIVTITDVGGKWGWWSFVWRHWRWAWTVVLIALIAALLVSALSWVLHPQRDRV
jgi:sugar phosphate permease